jgi:hypothetical protein
MRLDRTSILALGFVLTLVSAGLVSAHALPPVKAVSAPSAQAGMNPVLPSECHGSYAAEPLPGAALSSSASPATGTILAARKNCEAALAACMNNGGNSDACWNAYWRCIS